MTEEPLETLINRTGVIDVSDRTLISLTGDDRATFLHNMCTNEIKKLQPGHNIEAFITDVRGKTVGHVTVFCRDDALFLESVPGQADALINQLDRYVIREDVQLQEVTDMRKLLLVGPQSRRLLEELGMPGSRSENHLANSTLTIDGINVIVAGVPWSAHAWLLLADAKVADSMLSRLSDASVPECGSAAFEWIRISNLYPWFGTDFDASNLPQEVNRDSLAISFDKGCYLGQETVARIDALGHVNQMLTRVRGDADLEAGVEVLDGSKVVGRVTSVADEYGAPGRVGLAMLRREQHVDARQLMAGETPIQVMAS